MSMFTLAISCFDHFQFTLIHGPNIPGSCAILFFTASGFTSITSHIHNWALFSLWHHLFILSGVISSLFSSSILSTYQPEEFIFPCHIILPFHTVQYRISILNMYSMKVKVSQSCLTLCDPIDYTVHGILQARILEWVALPFSRGSSQPRNLARVSCIASRCVTN